MVLAAALVVLVSAGTPREARAGFNATTTYPVVTGRAQSLVVGLFGGGVGANQDIAVSTGADVELLVGHGDGTFAAPASVASLPNNGNLVGGDFNGDGLPDLAVTAEVNSGGYITGSAVYVFLGKGDGTFTADGSVSLGSTFAGGLATGDLNGDHVLDLIAGSTPFPVGLASDNVSVLLGNGDGTFTPGWSAGVPGAEHLAVADFNGDSRPDVVAAGNTGQVTVLLTGSGAFSSVTSIAVVSGTYARTNAVMALPLSGAAPDVVVGLAAGGTFAVLMNAGSGSFAAPVIYGTSGSQALAGPDLNLDGHPDVAVDEGSSVATWINSGTGTFTAASTYPVSNGILSIATGVFNGDTNYDLAVADSSGVDVLLGNTQASMPIGVTAAAGIGSATVSWNASPDDGGSAITSYTITSSAGGSVSVGPNARSVTLLGVALIPQTFTVTATNGYGQSAPSAPSNSVTPQPGGTYHALTPARVLDTRSGIGAPAAKVAPGQTVDVQVGGQAGVPVDGVGSVVLNVTVTGPTSAGYLTVFPTGSTRPTASNLNFIAGQTVPNLVEVALGTGGKVSFFNPLGSADVIADVQGWVGDSTDSYTPAGLFNALPPARILDTRSCHCPLGAGQTLSVQVTGRGGVPASGVSAVVINVTVTGPTRSSYLTVWPAGADRPVASNLNFSAGQTRANRVMVGIGTDGQVSIYNPFGTVNVIADVNGWFTDATSAAGGAAFVGEVPYRIFDTRESYCRCPLGPRNVLDLYSTGGPVPSALVLNATAVNGTAPSYLTLYPDNGSGGNGSVPLASDVNFAAGRVVPNLTVVKLGPGPLTGSYAFNVFNASGTVNVVLDEDGFYGVAVTAPPVSPLVMPLVSAKPGGGQPLRPKVWSTRRVERS
ncbi:MAG TPA: FG-GAP-like repeat-containing protein [Candidatus Dormibacteraeota bacterium]|nr:FG-GAP-like repeat-containing protein [Candidatus Dormibacteraeota bacterium]